MEPDSDVLELSNTDTLSQAKVSTISKSSVYDHPLPTRPVRIEVVLPSIAPSVRDEYVDLQSNVVECVVAEVKTADAGDTWYQVEFRDGRHNIVPFDEVVQLEGGADALDSYQLRTSIESNQRPLKRRRLSNELYEANGVESDRINIEESEDDEEDFGDSDEEELPVVRRSSRRTLRQKRPVSYNLDNWLAQGEMGLAKRRELQPRRLTSLALSRNGEDDADELAGEPTSFQQSSSDDDDDFQMVRSDLAPAPKRSRAKRKSRRLQSKASIVIPSHSRGSSIEFERPRRSGRSTRNTKVMTDSALMDVDSFYISDDKTSGVPRVASIKEIFRPLPSTSDFVQYHMLICDVCNQQASHKKGSLIYCQGCTLSFHKTCIGIRQGREHVVTKVGEDNFVFQCKFCVGRLGAKDPAARQSMCQGCKQDGLSCAPFSEKKSARQEEELRQQNGGVDPVTDVAAPLLNNPDNILFRCIGCRRPWHIEHLPTTRTLESDLADVKHERFKEYSVDWKCNECSSMSRKIESLVAWRPANQDAPATSRLVYTAVGYDDKEYLVKWEGLSYFHCSWMPGAWIYGVANAVMRTAFSKRAVQNSLLCLTSKEAIPEEYLRPDIIFQAKYHHAPPRARNKEEELSLISHVSKIYVKFEGLRYDDVVWDSPPSKDSGAIYAAFESAFIEYANGLYFRPDNPSKMRERVRQFKEASFKDEIELAEQPPGLRGKLMKYQLQGVNWMLHRYHQSENAILADEMGLGKTVQVISLITTLAFKSPRCWPFLIVVPNSTCPNWRREIKHWAPDLRVVAYHGGKTAQELAYKYELFPNGSRELRAHVVVMSYDSAQDDRTRGLFKSVHWAGVVIDEGQRLKNDKNLLYVALQGMNFPFKLLLTGTPLQNNKRELFNLLQFVDPQYGAAEMDEKYEVLTTENVRELHSIISPYFLRRTKAGVLKFLPGMAQIIIPVTMTVLQEKLCKSIMAKNPDLIRAIFSNSKIAAKERGSLNNILMQLRKCLCHPFIYSEAIEERDVNAKKMHRNLVEASGKLLLLELMLPKLKEQGHRVLIFSQFLAQLDIVEDFLAGMELSYKRLDGSMSSLEKQKRIDAFNAPGSDIFAFLLSTRAGGVGINLATADTVIIMDPDFNPHQDLQALSRAHRIGQRNRVLCFQLMTRNSVEEKIMQMGKKKLALDYALIERMDMEDAGDDLEGILRHGAEALFNDNEKEVIRYDAASVEKLLDRSQADKANEDGDTEEGSFSYARIFSAETGDIEEAALEHLDTPGELHQSVWDAILAERQAEAERARNMAVEKLGRGGRKRKTVNYRTNTKQAFGLDAADLSDSDRADKSSGGESELYNGGTNDDQASDTDFEGRPSAATDSVAAEGAADRIQSDALIKEQDDKRKRNRKSANVQPKNPEQLPPLATTNRQPQQSQVHPGHIKRAVQQDKGLAPAWLTSNGGLAVLCRRLILRYRNLWSKCRITGPKRLRAHVQLLFCQASGNNKRPESWQRPREIMPRGNLRSGLL
ncbi:hypothetical protein jhhlp_006212 [Lomentospora prolificans]|uniref:PHD-type domain-containing protein n=1 Tax=Lomentospora prolificans TaxID=41688 RepID=A0A2N3N5A4_9PEZI|nr:hypothetical protein jhhlp_006212 [Lomentospora prolificans]